MFDRVYLGPTARAEHAKIERVLRGLFDWYVAHPDELPPGVAGAGGGRPRDRLPGGDDRPLRHPRVVGALRAARPGELMARYTDDSRERVRDAVDFVELVGARTELKPAGPRRMTGLCPFHDERTPSFGIDPVEKLYHCFGCGAGGDVFKFAMETEGLDFAAALEALAERSGVELEREAEDPREAERRGRRDRLLGAARAHRRVLRARAVGVRRGGAGARLPAPSAGCRRTCCASSASASRRDAWDRVIGASRRDGFSEAGAARRRARVAPRATARGLLDRFRGRIMFPLADPKGHVLRLRRPRAGRRRPAEVPQHVGVRAVPQGQPRLRRRPRPRGRAPAPAGSCWSRATPT